MTISEARKILWDVWNQLSDEKVEELIALYRAIARVFINKEHKSKPENTQD